MTSADSLSKRAGCSSTKYGGVANLRYGRRGVEPAPLLRPRVAPHPAPPTRLRPTREQPGAPPFAWLCSARLVVDADDSTSQRCSPCRSLPLLALLHIVASAATHPHHHQKPLHLSLLMGWVEMGSMDWVLIWIMYGWIQMGCIS